MGVNSLFLEVHESNDNKVAYSVGKIDSQSQMPLFDKLKTLEFAKGKTPTIAKMTDRQFLEIHVTDTFIGSNNLEYQIMQMADDGSIMLLASGEMGIKGQLPRQVLIDGTNFVFFTDMKGNINFVTAYLYGHTIVFSDAKILVSGDQNIQGSRVSISEAKGYWVLSYNSNG